MTKLDKIVNSWSGKKVESLSISVGCAPSCDFAGYSVENLVKEADKLMYRQKQEYYRKKRANARKGN